MKEIKCIRCKRPLYSTRARAIGMGTTCARKAPAMLAHHLVEQAGQMMLFAQELATAPSRRPGETDTDFSARLRLVPVVLPFPTWSDEKC